MTLTELSYLLAGLGVLAVNIGGVYVAWRALFRDRAAGRRRCPRCWHDLTFTEGLRCTECGSVASGERHLRRTRRRWGVAGLAMGVCVTLALFLYYHLADSNIARYVPTAMLLPVMPVGGPASSSISTEIMRRATRNELTDAQWSRVIRRASVGDWSARPPDATWVAKYAPLIGHRRWQIAQDEELEWPEGDLEAVMQIPPNVSLSTRSAWPEGSTPSVRVQFRDWWPVGGLRRLRITPRLDDARTTTINRAGRGRFRDGYFLPVAGLTGKRNEVEFDVEVELRRDDAWESVSLRTVAVDIDFAPPGDGPKAISGDEMDAALAATFEQGAVRWVEGGQSPVRFRFRPQSTYTPAFADAAIGVHVDVLRNGDLARRLDIWWRGGNTVVDRGVGWESSGEDLDLLMEIAEDASWEMRITGDPDLALRAGDAAAYWAGQVTIDLTVTELPGAAPRPTWWKEQEEETE